MAFGGKTHNGARPMLAQECENGVTVADVESLQRKLRVRPNCRQILKIAGVRQLVDYKYGLVGPAEPINDKIRPNESGTAGHYDHQTPCMCGPNSRG